MKPCARSGCSEVAVQRPTESPASFLARQFHSRECAQMARRKGELTQREQRAARSEEYKARTAARRKARAAERELEKVVEPPKPLIRPVPVRQPKPEPGVWRPAFLAERDRQRAQ